MYQLLESTCTLSLQVAFDEMVEPEANHPSLSSSSGECLCDLMGALRNLAVPFLKTRASFPTGIGI